MAGWDDDDDDPELLDDDDDEQRERDDDEPDDFSLTSPDDDTGWDGPEIPQTWDEWWDFDWEQYDGDYEEYAVSADYNGE